MRTDQVQIVVSKYRSCDRDRGNDNYSAAMDEVIRARIGFAGSLIGWLSDIAVSHLSPNWPDRIYWSVLLVICPIILWWGLWPFTARFIHWGYQRRVTLREAAIVVCGATGIDQARNSEDRNATLAAAIDRILVHGVPITAMHSTEGESVPIRAAELSRLHSIRGSNCLRSDFASENIAYTDATVSRQDIEHYTEFLLGLSSASI